MCPFLPHNILERFSYFSHFLIVSFAFALKKLPAKGNLTGGVSLLDCGSLEGTVMIELEECESENEERQAGDNFLSPFLTPMWQHTKINAVCEA